MTLETLKGKFNDLVGYLAQLERHHTNEREAMQSDIDSLLARVAALEAQLPTTHKKR